MKKTILFSIFILSATFLMAQTPIPQWEKDLAKYIVAIIAWGVNNWDEVLSLFIGMLGALEIFLRVFVSEKNLAPLTRFIQKLDDWLPNRAKGGGVFKTEVNKYEDKWPKQR